MFYNVRLILLVSLFSLLGPYPKLFAAELRNSSILLDSASCKNPQFGKLTWQAKVQLDDGGIEASEAVVKQIRFLNGLAHSESRDTFWKETILLQDGSWELLKGADASGGLVQYQAQQSIVYCGSGSSPSRVELALPRKPSKASFMCVDDAIAPVSRPSLYWYGWDPNRVGVDGHGQRFDCSAHLRKVSGLEIAKATVSVHSVDESRDMKWPDLKRLSFSVYMSWVSDEDPKTTYRDLVKAWNDQRSAFLTLQAKDLTLPSASSHAEDASWRALLDFLNRLKQTGKVLSVSPRVEQNSFSLAVELETRTNGKQVHFDIFFGPEPSHDSNGEKFISKAAEESDIFFFVGHARAGRGFDWLKHFHGSSTQTKIVGIVACFAASLVDLKTFQKDSSPMDFWLADFQSYRYLEPIAFLEIFADGLRSAASQKPVINKYLKPGERWAMVGTAR